MENNIIGPYSHGAVNGKGIINLAFTAQLKYSLLWLALLLALGAFPSKSYAQG